MWKCQRCDKKFATERELKEHQDDQDLCENCCGELNDEDFIEVSESRGEFWGAPAYETIVVGYKCSHCGYKGDY